MTENNKIRAMIIDDSALMRNLVTRVLESCPQISVAGTALNGRFGLNKINKLRPDIIILDLEMPEMNGIEFLKERNRLNIKTPVIILSSHAKKGARITLEALALGASDFILKPSQAGTDLTHTSERLIQMVLALATPNSFSEARIKEGEFKREIKFEAAAVVKAEEQDMESYLQPIKNVPQIKLVSIGISTGGPNALRKILPEFPVDFPVPIVIVQHMPPGFTYEFARSLDKICPLSVKEAEDYDILKPGRVLIAPGDRHVRFESKSLATVVRLDDSPPVNGHRPSADILFEATAATFQGNALGCIMTGMGKDGAENIGRIMNCGGITISQDQQSSIVFGMPQVAIKKGNIQLIRPLSEIAGTIIKLVTSRTV